MLINVKMAMSMLNFLKKFYNLKAWPDRFANAFVAKILHAALRFFYKLMSLCFEKSGGLKIYFNVLAKFSVRFWLE